MPPSVTRRRFLELAAAGGAAAALPWAAGCGDASGEPAPRFLTAEERATLEALAEAIVPEDETVGAVGAGAVEFIDRLLAAFDVDPPLIFGGGPFSGREPFPDERTGEPTGRFPSNRFREPIPLTRLQRLAFRIELFGSASVPNGEINAPIVPSTRGLRAIYREGLAALEREARARGVASLAELDEEARLEIFAAADPELRDAVVEHIGQGMFAAPEYGGNRDGIAWRDYAYDGDSQPLGHTLFDRTTQTLRDRPDAPNQIEDPARPPRPFPPDVESLVEAIAISQGGQRFF